MVTKTKETELTVTALAEQLKTDGDSIRRLDNSRKGVSEGISREFFTRICEIEDRMGSVAALIPHIDPRDAIEMAIQAAFARLEVEEYLTDDHTRNRRLVGVRNLLQQVQKAFEDASKTRVSGVTGGYIGRSTTGDIDLQVVGG